MEVQKGIINKRSSHLHDSIEKNYLQMATSIQGLFYKLRAWVLHNKKRAKKSGKTVQL